MTTMTFHTHPGSSRKLFAALKDGLCRACRPAAADAAVAAILDHPGYVEPVLSGSQSVSNSGELPMVTIRPGAIEANVRACMEVGERLKAEHASPKATYTRAQLRAIRTQAIRAQRDIVLRWKAADGSHGEEVIGANESTDVRKAAWAKGEEHRALGRKVVFSLVKVR